MCRHQRRRAALHRSVGPSVLRRPANGPSAASQAPPSGWAVRPSAASASSVRLGRNAPNRSLHAPFVSVGQVKPVPLRKSMNAMRTSAPTAAGAANRRINPVVSEHRASSSALRITAAPGPQGRSGASYRSRRAASCRVAVREVLSSSTMRPNTSIEGTSCQPLRVCQAAPHVKR